VRCLLLLSILFATQLSSIDTLLQTRPDSALTLLLDESLDEPYYQLLLSEALYKNDYQQANRDDLLDAVAYFDSIGDPFLSARAHYINGVGYYEMDSLVAACAEYLKALEIMETHFKEKELVGYKAKFMALGYTRLCRLFTDQYLHLQAIGFARKAYVYYKKQDPTFWHSAWALNKIGLNYEMMEQLDSSTYYYQKAVTAIVDTNSLIFRDICAHQVLIDYKKGNPAEKALYRLKYLLTQSETRNEYYARCSAVGEVYFHEKEYDSATIYLRRLFEGNANISLKKQAAELLVEIHREKGALMEALPYADYLVPFANLSENQGFIKSQLVDVYQSYAQRREDYIYQLHVNRNRRRAIVIIEWFVAGLIFFAILFLFRTKQLKNERQEHKIKHAALAGRLKQSNAALKKERETKVKMPLPVNTNQDPDIDFKDETICRHILSVCNDKKNPIKSNLPVTAYTDLALTHKQEAQLKDAVNRHYGLLFENLKSLYPELKRKDLLYCYLCLLGLDNSQIAVMTQLSYRTIWDREKRLQKIFGTDNKVSVVLYGFLIS